MQDLLCLAVCTVIFLYRQWCFGKNVSKPVATKGKNIPKKRKKRKKQKKNPKENEEEKSLGRWLHASIGRKQREVRKEHD